MPASSSGSVDSRYDFKDSELHITMGTTDKLSPILSRRAVPATASCPIDLPLWSSPTHTSWDRRQMQPFTLKYALQKDERFSHLVYIQDAICQQIWSSVRELARKHCAGAAMPTILIDCDPLDNAKRYGCIEMTFESSDLFAWVHHSMFCLKIASVAEGVRCCFDLVNWSHSLEPNVMPFDILRLPLTPDNTESVHKSLKTMFASLGTVVGLANIETQTKAYSSEYTGTNTIRGYLELNAASMKMPFSSLIAAVPTHFVWQHIPRTLQYSGRQLHQVAKHSDDYPLEEASSADGSASSSTPSTSASTASSSGGSNIKVEGSNDSNKRKRK